MLMELQDRISRIDWNKEELVYVGLTCIGKVVDPLKFWGRTILPKAQIPFRGDFMNFCNFQECRWLISPDVGGNFVGFWIWIPKILTGVTFIPWDLRIRFFLVRNSHRDDRIQKHLNPLVVEQPRLNSLVHLSNLVELSWAENCCDITIASNSEGSIFVFQNLGFNFRVVVAP